MDGVDGAALLAGGTPALPGWAGSQLALPGREVSWMPGMDGAVVAGGMVTGCGLPAAAGWELVRFLRCLRRWCFFIVPRVIGQGEGNCNSRSDPYGYNFPQFFSGGRMLAVGIW